MTTPHLVLYHGLASTCSKKVRLVLFEKNLTFESHLLDLQQFEQHTPDYLALNPNGVVPTLVHDGRIIVESNVIIEYLDEVFPQVPLVPADPYERARMRVITRFADTAAYEAVYVLTWLRLSAPAARRLAPADLARVLASVPTTERRERWRAVATHGFSEVEVEQSFRKMKDVLARLDTWLTHGESWLLGERFSLAEIAVVPFVARISNLAPELLEAGPLTQLRRWLALFKRRPAYSPAMAFKGDPRVHELTNI